MIQTQDYVKTYATGNNVTLWGIAFPFYSFDDINLYVITDGVKTQIESSDFEILPNEDSETIATIKYNVHYPKVGNPLSEGSTIMIERITPITQVEDSSQVYFNSKDVERIADKLTMIAQENRGLATDETAGLIQIATQDEVNAGVNATKAVTPATLQNKLTPLLSAKQDTIDDLTTIRSGASAGSTAVQPATLTTALLTKQDTLTAGPGITISGSTISTNSAAPAWGNITGTLANQTDLNTALSAKQSTSNLVTSISSLSTDTEYPSAKCVYDAISQSGGGTPTLTWYTGNTGTTVTIADTSTAQLVKVYRNGILLQEGNANDYTISGTTLTLTTALIATDKIATEVF